MPTNNEIFREFVRGYKPALPILPAVHIARGVNINEIFATNKLRLTLCKNFHKELVYLFYGKSAYRLKSDSDSVSVMVKDAAVCFVLNVTKLPDAHRVFALDTGASFCNRYDSYFEGGVSIDDFELDPSSNSAAKFVKAFFGKNKNYFLGDAKPNIRIPGLDVISDVYKAMATAVVSTSFDERARTCELQYGVDLEINKDSLYTIIMPDRLSGDKRCKDKMKEWGVRPITYLFRGGKPGDRTEIVFEKLGEYYGKKRFM